MQCTAPPNRQTGLPAPFLLRLVALHQLACWKTAEPNERGEGYFFARSDLEALRPAVEEAGKRALAAASWCGGWGGLAQGRVG